MDKSNTKKMEPTDDSTIAMAESQNTECKYCKPKQEDQAAHSLTNCPYCKQIESEDPADTACKYCAAMGSSEAGNECPYCAQMPEVNLPTTTDSQNYEGQALDAPAMPKPDPSQEPPIGQAAPTDIPVTNNNQALEQQGVPNEIIGEKIPQESVQLDQSKAAMQQIAQEIEQNDQTGQVQSEVSQNQALVNTTDATDAAVGTQMEGNVSRPAGFDANVPGDMGLAEDAPVQGPDLTEVLQGGLDNQAQNINRERVVQMVSQALEGFKASKQIIEKAQQQAPQLYQSSIMMLKAMIEMAKMLGLDKEGAPTPEGNPLEGQPQSEWQDPFPQHPDQGGATLAPGHAAPEGQVAADGVANPEEWSNPFPTHPDQGGAMAPGHAPGSAGGTAIGQGVGKLPTSATTQHVARTPFSEGAVNDKGQKKVTDPQTGEVRWIDMKQGRVQGPTGIPVKPQG